MRVIIMKKKGKTHKEDRKSRMQSDAEKSRKLQLDLSNFCPLEIKFHISDKLVIIYSGEETADNVNANKTIEMENQQLI